MKGKERQMWRLNYCAGCVYNCEEEEKGGVCRLVQSLRCGRKECALTSVCVYLLYFRGQQSVFEEKHRGGHGLCLSQFWEGQNVICLFSLSSFFSSFIARFTFQPNQNTEIQIFCRRIRVQDETSISHRRDKNEKTAACRRCSPHLLSSPLLPALSALLRNQLFLHNHVLSQIGRAHV